MNELAQSCVAFYRQNQREMGSQRVLENRASLSSFAETFHKDCGTLTASVKRRIEDLRNGAGVVLMTAHQPNLFAYAGVLRKATLNFVLARKLEETLKVPVVNFFGIADQDFTDDRWVRSCQLPAVQRSGGTLSIDAKLPEKLMLNKVPKPSSDVLNGWRSEIEKWLNDAVRSVERLCKALGFPEMCSTSSVSTLRENFVSFWSVVEGCYGCSENYSDFNAFVMSKIVNDVWGYDTVFARFSECQQIFTDEFAFLLSHFEKYSKLLKESRELPHKGSMESGVSDQEPWLVPFWYHCDCGSKAKLFLMENDSSLTGHGNCVGCDQHHELKFGTKKDPDISRIAPRISARAISMNLVFFKGLMPSCYVGGIGGVMYLKEAQHVAKGLGIPFPPIVVWRPNDNYVGVGQVEALLEMRRICADLGVRDVSEARKILASRLAEIYEHLDELETLKKKIMEKLSESPDDAELKEELKKISIARTNIGRFSNLSVLNHELRILENVSTVSDLIPSIIDYAVNIGLKEASDQWILYLSENGSLSSDVHLESVLSRNNPNYFSELTLIHTDDS